MHETPRPEDTKSRTGDKWAPLLGFLTLILLFATLSSVFLRQRLVVWIFLVLGIASLIAFVALRRQAILRFFVSRQVRYGANVGVTALLVTGIAVIANIIVVQRFDTSADWTSDKIYTLSDQTKKILHGLDREVQVIAFFSLNPTSEQLVRDRQRAQALLEMYQRETDKLSVELVDPYSGAMKSREYEIQFDGTTVFESGGVREQITTVDEQKFTSAILKVVRDELVKIYFLTGHEEQAIDNIDQNRGYSHTKEELEKQNYRIETLSLATQPEVPADCAALVIPGPKAPLMTHEINAISKYLSKNGKLFLMLDPSVSSAKDPNQGLVDLMDRWGITIGNDLVFDRIRPAFFLFGGSQPNAPTLGDFEFHQITQDVLRQVTFQLARSVTPKTSAGSTLNVKSLVKTTDEIGGSWGETKRKADGTFEEDLSYTEGEDTPPPVSLAVAVQREDSASTTSNDSTDTPKASGTRIVVVGDSDFANNLFFHGTGGGDFFLNAVNWLTLDEDLIAIRPVDPTERSLRMMTPHEVAFVQMTAIFLIPLIIFLIGVGVWWRRR